MKHVFPPPSHSVGASPETMNGIRTLFAEFGKAGGFNDAKPAICAVPFIQSSPVHALPAAQRQAIAKVLPVMGAIILGADNNEVAEIFAKGILDRLAADSKTAGPSPLAAVAPRAPSLPAPGSLNT
jgi:hypothetical protein